MAADQVVQNYWTFITELQSCFQNSCTLNIHSTAVGWITKSNHYSVFIIAQKYLIHILIIKYWNTDTSSKHFNAINNNIT